MYSSSGSALDCSVYLYFVKDSSYKWAGGPPVHTIVFFSFLTSFWISSNPPIWDFLLPLPANGVGAGLRLRLSRLAVWTLLPFYGTLGPISSDSSILTSSDSLGDNYCSCELISESSISRYSYSNSSLACSEMLLSVGDSTKGIPSTVAVVRLIVSVPFYSSCSVLRIDFLLGCDLFCDMFDLSFCMIFLGM